MAQQSNNLSQYSTFLQPVVTGFFVRYSRNKHTDFLISSKKFKKNSIMFLRSPKHFKDGKEFITVRRQHICSSFTLAQGQRGSTLWRASSRGLFHQLSNLVPITTLTTMVTIKYRLQCPSRIIFSGWRFTLCCYY